MQTALARLPDSAAKSAKESMDFRNTLNAETDRGCALMAAAYLENRLELLIKAFLIEKADDDLFNFNGAFGTFSSKIHVAYALGLIPNNLYKDLDILRRIRNEFAHRAEPTDFTTSCVENRINAFHFVDTKDLPRPRSKFTRTVMAMLAIIDADTWNTEKREQPDDVDTSAFLRGIKELDNKD